MPHYKPGCCSDTTGNGTDKAGNDTGNERSDCYAHAVAHAQTFMRQSSVRRWAGEYGLKNRRE